MGDSCDVSPFRAVKSASAAAVAERTVHVGPGATALTLEVKGQGDAPALRIVGPDGTRYDSPKKAAIVPGRDMIARDPRTKATDVMIAHPAAGKWKIEAEKGDKITSVSRATVDPVPHIDPASGGRASIVCSATATNLSRITAPGSSRRALTTSRSSASLTVRRAGS